MHTHIPTHFDHNLIILYNFCLSTIVPVSCYLQVIGSSLLFVYDKQQTSVHIIDFGKTTPLPAGVRVDHRSPWREANHEDGYLFGLDNLIELWREL